MKFLKALGCWSMGHDIQRVYVREFDGGEEARRESFEGVTRVDIQCVRCDKPYSKIDKDSIEHALYTEHTG